MNNNQLLKKLDIVFLVVFPLIATVTALFLKTNFLFTTLLFFGLPSVWFSLRTPRLVGKTALFSFAITISFMLIIDYIVTYDHGWWDSTMFSSRLFGILPYEDLIWAFFQVYVVVIFYEHFLEKGKHPLIYRQFRYLIYIITIILLAFFTALTLKPSLLHISFAYFWVLFLLGILPIITFISKFPRLLGKFLKTAVYFFYLNVLFEFAGLKLGNWVFPGQNYIGTINFFGNTVPYEEIIAWWMLIAVGILTYYEFFDDDRK